MNQTPSEQLFHRIIVRLVEKKLLSTGQGSNLLLRLLDGNLTGEDWQLAIESSIEEIEHGPA